MTKSHSTPAWRWPEGAIVYHIYPRSLKDSNGDGVGDIPGITTKLEYIQSLGVNAIWLSPFYPSPMADFGYDVADYCDVDPMFGSLKDFDELLQSAHDMGIKVIIDLVPNHTSDEHEWFKASRESRNNRYSDWYIWHDPIVTPQGERQPPNNWLGVFSGESAWEWHEGRQQYYLHSFHTKQPDLNWSNPNVRRAMQDVMRFWLNRGVDGFRVDAVLWMAKHPLLQDDPPNEHWRRDIDHPYERLEHTASRGWKHLYARLFELAEVLNEPAYRERQPFMVTEAYPERHNPVADYLTFYEGMDPAVAAPFNFEGVSLPWDAGKWQHFLRRFHSSLDQLSPQCVASYAFGNHDQPRLVSRLGEAQARAAAVMLLTLPGMAFIYYGEELGMADVPVPAEAVQDPQAAGDPKFHGRDPERTPMQWSSEPFAGFSTATPWLPVADNFKVQNVEQQSADPQSFLSLYRRLGMLRNTMPALRRGSFAVHECHQGSVVAYLRREPSQNGSTTTASTSNGKDAGNGLSGDVLVLINFSDQTVSCSPGVAVNTCLASSYPQSSNEAVSGTDSVRLRPYEAVLLGVHAPHPSE